MKCVQASPVSSKRFLWYNGGCTAYHVLNCLQQLPPVPRTFTVKAPLGSLTRKQIVLKLNESSTIVNVLFYEILQIYIYV